MPTSNSTFQLDHVLAENEWLERDIRCPGWDTGKCQGKLKAQWVGAIPFTAR